MYRKVKKIFIIFLFLFISKPSHAIFAGKIITMQHTWPHNVFFDSLSFSQQITYDGGPASIYFWGNQFQFKNGKSGYIGLFNRGSRTVHFFILDATGWQSGKCKHFTYDGSGVRCKIEFPWQLGRQYKLDVSKNGNFVTGTIIDVITGKMTKVGVIEVPSNFGKLYNSSSFVEDHSRWNRRLSSCYGLNPQSSIFFNPTANKNDTPYQALQEAYAQGICKDRYVVQIACNLNYCMNNISDLEGLASPVTKKVSIDNGKDLSAQTISDALKKEELIAIRLLNDSWAPHIFLPEAHLFKWKSIFVDHQAALSSSLHVNNSTQKITIGQKIMYMSDGKIWKIMQKN